MMLLNNVEAGKFFFRLLFLFPLMSCLISSEAQVVIPSKFMHDLDTIFYFPELCNENAGEENLKIASFDDELLITYYNSALHKDTINFLIINIKNKTIYRHSKIIDKLRESVYGINSIAFNSKYISFTTSSYIYYFERTDLKNEKYETIKNEFDDMYTDVKFINDNTMLLSRCYNFYRPKNKTYAKVKLCIYDINKKKSLKCIEPSISNIALTHIQPVQLISAEKNEIIVGQNAVYKYDILDENLNYKHSKTRQFKDWIPIDSSELEGLSKTSKSDPTRMIQYLQPKFLSGYSLCNKYSFVDEKTFVVDYTLGQNSPDTIERLTDVWRKTKGEWHLGDTTYINRVIFDTDSLEAISNTNYDNNIWWYSNTIYSQNYTIIYFKGTNVYPIGLSRKEYSLKNTEYYKKNDPIINLVILKRKY